MRLRAVLKAPRAGVTVAASPSDHRPNRCGSKRLAVAATRGTGIALMPLALWLRLDTAPQARVHDAGAAAKNRATRVPEPNSYSADDPNGFQFAAEPLERLPWEADTLNAQYHSSIFELAHLKPSSVGRPDGRWAAAIAGSRPCYWRRLPQRALIPFSLLTIQLRGERFRAAKLKTELRYIIGAGTTLYHGCFR